MKKTALYLAAIAALAGEQSALAGTFRLYNRTPDAATFKFYSANTQIGQAEVAGMKPGAQGPTRQDFTTNQGVAKITIKPKKFLAQETTLALPTAAVRGEIRAEIKNGKFTVSEKLSDR